MLVGARNLVDAHSIHLKQSKLDLCLILNEALFIELSYQFCFLLATSRRLLGDFLELKHALLLQHQPLLFYRL